MSVARTFVVVLIVLGSCLPATANGNAVVALPERAVPAGDTADARGVLADRLFVVQKTRRAIEGWRQTLFTFDPANCGCGDDPAELVRHASAWENAVATGFRADRVLARLKSVMVRHSTRADLEDMIALASQTLAQRIVAAETQQGSGMEAQVLTLADTEQARDSLLNEPERHGLVLEILKEWGGADATIELMQSVARGVYRGVRLELRGGLAMPGEETMATAQAESTDMLKEVVEPMMIGGYALIYRSFSKAELSRYVGRLRQPKQRAYRTMIQRVFITTASEEAERVGRRYARALNAVDL